MVPENKEHDFESEDEEVDYWSCCTECSDHDGCSLENYYRYSNEDTSNENYYYSNEESCYQLSESRSSNTPPRVKINTSGSVTKETDQDNNLSNKLVGDEKEKEDQKTCFVTGDPTQLPPPKTDHLLTVIFDLDETLISAEYTPEIYQVTLRPNAIQLLQTLKEAGAELILWSAGAQFHVEKCQKDLDPQSSIFSAVIYRDDAWYEKGHPIFKKLSLIPYRSPERLLLVENNHVAAFQQTDQVLVIPGFHHSNLASDTVLYQLEKWFLTFLPKCTSSPNISTDTKHSVELKLIGNQFLFQGLVCGVCHKYFECSDCTDAQKKNPLVFCSKLVHHTYNYFSGGGT